MEGISNVSSEEELLQLRNEGKISGAEYNDLLAAMRKPPPHNGEEVASGTDSAVTKGILGKIAVILMLAGVVLPCLCYFALALGSGPNANTDIAQLCFYTGLACEIAAFVLGRISRRDPYGKTAMISALVLAVLYIIIIVLFF